MAAPVLWLTGFPGTGKYTVARALEAELAERGVVTKVVDNHLIANPVFTVLREFEDALPERVWELIGQVREAVLTTLEELSDPAHALVFTNFVVQSEAEDVRPFLARLARLAEARGGRPRVIALGCRTEELLRRVTTPSRRDRLKATSASWVQAQLDAHEALVLPESETLDITRLAPEEAARRILDGGR